MMLIRYSNHTLLRPNGKYLNKSNNRFTSLKNSYVFSALSRHIQNMAKSVKNVEVWVNQKWLSVKEVCDFLGISKSTFYKWRQMDRAPQSVRLPNGDLRVREDWLADFMANLPEGNY